MDLLVLGQEGQEWRWLCARQEGGEGSLDAACRLGHGGGPEGANGELAGCRELGS